jgi:hypothetical protein
MMGDDMQRGNDIGNRKRSYETNGNYSPSASYKYSPGNSSFQQSPQQQRRRGERFKKTGGDLSEKIVKQNDQIIKLLREIRDRLGSGGAHQSYRSGQSKRRGNSSRHSFMADHDDVSNIDDEITLSEPLSGGSLDLDDND